MRRAQETRRTPSPFPRWSRGVRDSTNLYPLIQTFLNRLSLNSFFCCRLSVACLVLDFMNFINILHLLKFKTLELQRFYLNKLRDSHSVSDLHDGTKRMNIKQTRECNLNMFCLHQTKSGGYTHTDDHAVGAVACQDSRVCCGPLCRCATSLQLARRKPGRRALRPAHAHHGRPH